MRALRLVPLLLAAGAPAARAQGAGSAAGPIESCCTITVINPRTRIVTARERSTGKTFRFEVKHRTLLKTLTAGQAVWADFAARRVSVGPAERAAGQPATNPGALCCPILPEVNQ